MRRYATIAAGALLALLLFNPPGMSRSDIFLYTLIVLTAALTVTVYMKKITVRHAALGYLAYFTVFISLVFYAIPTQAISVGTGTILNDNWWAALNWIRENTAECATIATYWDPGHFITAIAKRPVIFGGTSQNDIKKIPYDGDKTGFEIINYDHGIKQLVRYEDGEIVRARIKDIATVLMTANESLAVQILKDYSGDCNELYFVASQDLIFKSVWWSYFATWDPTAEGQKGMQLQYAFIQRARRAPIQSLGIVGHEYPVGGGSIILCENNGTISQCTNSIVGMFQAGNQFMRLQRLILPVSDGLRVLEDKDVTEGREQGIRGTVFVPDPGGGTIIYMPEELESAMFTRMMFFNGLGLEKFRLAGNWGGEFKLFKVDVS